MQCVEQNTTFPMTNVMVREITTGADCQKKVAAYTIPISYYLYIQQTSAVPTKTTTFLASVLFQCIKLDSW